MYPYLIIVCYDLKYNKPYLWRRSEIPRDPAAVKNAREEDGQMARWHGGQNSKIVQLQSSSMNFNRKKIKTQRQTYRKEYQSQ